MNILITGGSGMVGSHLCAKLADKGYQVTVMTRKQDTLPYPSISLEEIIHNPPFLKQFQYIIHLAGANISDKRWTDKRKKEIVESRVKPAEQLFSIVKSLEIPLKAFISASAVGYYGTVTSNKVFEEDDASGNDFLSHVCKKWEDAADLFSSIGARVVKIRTSVVLSDSKSALQLMEKPVKMNLASPLGSGNQYIPWIHIEDLCNIYIKAIEDSAMVGVYNAASPAHATNKEFIKTLSGVLKKPFWNVNVPSFTLKLLFGEMSSILLKGSRICSKKIQNTGYCFSYPTLTPALKNLLIEQDKDDA